MIIHRKFPEDAIDWGTTPVRVYLPSGRLLGPFKNAASIPEKINELHRKAWAAYAANEPPPPGDVLR